MGGRDCNSFAGLPHNVDLSNACGTQLTTTLPTASRTVSVDSHVPWCKRKARSNVENPNRMNPASDTCNVPPTTSACVSLFHNDSSSPSLIELPGKVGTVYS